MEIKYFIIKVIIAIISMSILLLGGCNENVSLLMGAVCGLSVGYIVKIKMNIWRKK